MRALPPLALALAGLLAVSATYVRQSSPPEPPSQQPDVAADDAPDPAELQQEIAAAQRELELARAQAELARLESEGDELKAAQGLEAAQAALVAFETFEQQARIAAGELKLKQEQDGADDARDEMNQLAALYGMGDLADKTAEIVLRRAQRGLDRAEESLRLARADHLQMVNVALPREQIELRAEVRADEFELRRIEMQRRVHEIENRNAVAALEDKLANLKQDLADALAAAQAAK